VSVLALVRHAQASFFADEYDQLSPAGEAQARRLGDYWAARGDVFSEVFVGPRRRQQQTADLVGGAYRRAGLPWPEPVLLPELDEYDLAGLLGRLAPALAGKDQAFERLVAVHRLSEGDVERTRTFQHMLEVLLTHWLTAPAAGAEALEPWSEFRGRVARGLERMTVGSPRGRRVAAFTSGGWIGAAAAYVLGAPDRTALELSWRLRNASLSHLVFSPGRVTLDDFNVLPHLADPALWTYR
jgi:broad specificity phosphatase PhoE